MCNDRFYRAVDGICKTVDISCQTYEATTGACTSCYDGSTLHETLCIPDPNCAQFVNNICEQCNEGFLLLNNGSCQKANPDCATYNTENGLCASCHSGFDLVEGSCILNPETPTPDPNCRAFYINISCQTCAENYTLDGNGGCVQVDPNCQLFNVQQLIC